MKKLFLALIVFASGVLFNGCSMEDEPRPRPPLPFYPNTDPTTLPFYVSIFNLPSGYYDSGDMSVVMTPSKGGCGGDEDSIWAASCITLDYTVGSKKWFGAHFLNNNANGDWSKYFDVPAGIKKFQFSIKADAGLKVTINAFPDNGTHATYITTGDGEWHDVVMVLDPNKTYPSKVVAPMNIILNPPVGAAAGSTHSVTIRNIIGLGE